MMWTAILPVVAALLGWAGAALVRARAQRLGLVSVPDKRDSHTKPTPRGGGIGIAFGGIVALIVLGIVAQEAAVNLMAIAIICAVAAALGFRDDLIGLRVSVRMAVQALLVAMLVAGLIPLVRFDIAGMGFPFLLAVALVWFAGLWWINLFNFMDGTDGLAAAHAIFMLVAAGLVAIVVGSADARDSLIVAAVSIAAATAGFLVHNWPPAKIFMGDVGSLFLGTAIFALSLAFWLSGVTSPWVWAILATPFVSDATVTLVRRYRRGDKVTAAHRSHAYQRLSRRWGSHLSVLLALLAIDVAWVLPLAACAAFWVDLAPVFVLVAAAPLVAGAYWAGAGLPDEL